MRAGEGRSIAGTVNFIPEIISAIVKGGSKRSNLPNFINELILKEVEKIELKSN